MVVFLNRLLLALARWVTVDILSAQLQGHRPVIARINWKWVIVGLVTTISLALIGFMALIVLLIRLFIH